jgi:hypothetical protein
MAQVYPCLNWSGGIVIGTKPLCAAASRFSVLRLQMTRSTESGLARPDGGASDRNVYRVRDSLLKERKTYGYTALSPFTIVPSMPSITP